MRRRPASLLAALAGLASTFAAPAVTGAAPMPTAPRVLDGSGQVAQPSALQMAVARDGTGALVYLRQDPGTGTEHVFLSRLLDGSFGPPVRVDAALGAGSSQPAVAAGNGGAVLVAFVNGGTLFTVTIPSAAAGLPEPQAMASAAQAPALSMNNLGKAYLVYAARDGAGSDVHAIPYGPGGWGAVTPPLNVYPGDSAGTASGRAQVATAGDGTAIVVWGENGHVFTRRVTASTPSTDLEQVDGAFADCTPSSADEPVVGTGGDSSYAAIALRETVSCGGGIQQQRVIARRLVSNILNPPLAADGVSAGSSLSGAEPQVAVGEYGRGFVTAVRGDGAVVATPLSSNDVLGTPTVINQESDAGDPAALPALAGLASTFIVWQQTPGSGAAADIRLRYAEGGGPLGAESVLSSPAAGPSDAAGGLAAAGDTDGDAAVVWLQGNPGGESLMTEQLYQPPGGFSPNLTFSFSRSQQPTLGWSSPQELWGLGYAVSIDGRPLALTAANSLKVPITLADGPHTWQVSATNPAGQSRTARAAVIFVDSTPPQAALTVTGRAIVGDYLHVAVTAADRPPDGEPAADASGLARISLDFGDGTQVRSATGGYHAWHAAGTYRLTLVVHDRAGNVTTVTRIVHIRPRPKAKPKPKPRPKARPKASKASLASSGAGSR